MTVQPILRWSSRTLQGRTLMSRRSAAKTFPQSGWKTAVFQSNCLSAGERQSPSADRRTGSAWCFYKNRPAGKFAGLFFTIKIHVSSKRCNQGKKRDLAALIYGHVPSIRLGERNLQRNGEANQAARWFCRNRKQRSVATCLFQAPETDKADCLWDLFPKVRHIKNNIIFCLQYIVFFVEKQ